MAVHISIHAPAKGATLMIILYMKPMIYFNPRTREGCDLADSFLVPSVFFISIHAPVKGATVQNMYIMHKNIPIYA